MSPNPPAGPSFADFLGAQLLLAPLNHTLNFRTPEKFQVVNAFRGASNSCTPSLAEFFQRLLNTCPICQRDQKPRAQVIFAPLSASEIWQICLFFTLPYPFLKLINTKKNNNYQTQKLTINHNKQVLELNYIGFASKHNKISSS
jgi:hypothetical protein